MRNKLERKQMKIYASNPTKPTDIIAYGSDIVGPRVNTTDPDKIQTAQYEKGVRTAVVGKRSTSLQNRQTLDYLFSRALKYLFQIGVAEWLVTEEYFIGSVVSDGEGGLFVSKTDNNIGNALSNTTHWDKFPTAKNLAEKVNKAGDTMTGALKMSGVNEIRFGTDDDFYTISKVSNGNIHIYSNDSKGIFLKKDANSSPFYWDGISVKRILTSADLANIDYVVEYKNPTDSDPTWYRKWKSGKLEQGGVVPATEENITFLKPFANTNYTVIGNISLTYRRAGQGDGSGSVLFFPEATSFCYVTWAARNFGDIGRQNISWRAEGQGAQ